MIIHNYIDEKPSGNEEVIFIRKDFKEFGIGYYRQYTTCEPGDGSIEEVSYWTGITSLFDENGKLSAMCRHDLQEYPYWTTRESMLFDAMAMVSITPDNIVDYIYAAMEKMKETDPVDRFDILDLEK